MTIVLLIGLILLIAVLIVAVYSAFHGPTPYDPSCCDEYEDWDKDDKEQ